MQQKEVFSTNKNTSTNHPAQHYIKSYKNSQYPQPLHRPTTTRTSTSSQKQNSRFISIPAKSPIRSPHLRKLSYPSGLEPIARPMMTPDVQYYYPVGHRMRFARVSGTERPNKKKHESDICLGGYTRPRVKLAARGKTKKSTPGRERLASSSASSPLLPRASCSLLSPEGGCCCAAMMLFVWRAIAGELFFFLSFVWLDNSGKAVCWGVG